MFYNQSTKDMDKEELKQSIRVIEDAISSMLQAFHYWESGERDMINGEWLIRSCAGLNEIKITMEGELMQ